MEASTGKAKVVIVAGVDSTTRLAAWTLLGLTLLLDAGIIALMTSTIAFGLQPEAAMPLKWPFAWLVRWLWLLWLMLIAVVMPDLNGVVATQRILGQNPTIGVIMLTMLEDDETVFAAMCAVARGYILKGSGKAEVLHTIQIVASGAAMFGPAIAGRLHISPRTVGNHISNIFNKLQVSDRAQAIVKAREAGLGKEST